MGMNYIATDRQRYKELGHNPDNYSDGDKPVLDNDSNIDNDHNNLESAKAKARQKLDAYLMNHKPNIDAHPTNPSGIGGVL